MGFALKQHGVPKEERITRVRETARILDLEPFLDRKPRHLSGGQRQRVAMGRAIVRQPAVYLMDEPLSNLDAKLRVQTRTEVVELQNRLGVTTVYVTHDQVEAMTMGHRVAVLKDGVLQQCDAPAHAVPRARQPVRGRLHRLAGDEPRRRRRGAPAEIGEPSSSSTAADVAAAGDAGATVGFRPEALRGRRRAAPARIRTVEDLGSEMFVHVAVDHRGDSVPLIAKMSPPFDGEPDDHVGLQIAGTTHVFGEDGSRIASSRASLRSSGAVSRS